MRLNDVFHNRQPQPGAASITAAGFINAEEAFEYFVQRFSWNAGAVVNDGYFNHFLPRLIFRGFHPHSTTMATIFDGVIDEIKNNLLHSVSINM